MIRILEIPKNASRFANTISHWVTCGPDVDVVFLRDPYARFWSAVKTITPEISYYGSYPPEGTEKLTSYAGRDVDIAGSIDRAISTFGSPNIDIHLVPQHAFTDGRKFDEVLILDDNFDQAVAELMAKYCRVVTQNADFTIRVNVSPHDIDEQALAYIQNTPAVKQALDDFYAGDFELLANPERLKK